jgi:class 3 adenylate cyclase
VATDAEANTNPASVSVEEIASRLGISAEVVERLVETGVLKPDGDGRFDPGDIHRIRLLSGFEAAGVPLDALVAADRAGRISLRYYDQLHPPPGPLSGRSYGEFAASVGPGAAHLPGLFAAFGLAEPGADTSLDVETETLVAEMLEVIELIGQPDLALRAIRLFGEGARRSADGALAVYADAVDRLTGDVAGLPTEAVFERVLWPWARFARQSTPLASWLASQHLTRAIDEYSVTQTERILEADGYVAPRPTAPPAIGFVDLTGFTQLTQERGDETAAAIALRLGEVTVDAVRGHRGRVVKLLGDGVLVRFDDLPGAIDGALDVLDALPASGLPSGHAGVAAGYVIERDNDVFGRTVNLASRIADAAPDGRLYVAAGDAKALPGDAGYEVMAVEPVSLQGIGIVDVVAVARTAGTAPSSR